MDNAFEPEFVSDLSALETHGYGNRAVTWWGTMGLVAVEGTAFALACVSYVYLATHSREWPPHGVRPDLAFGTWFTVLTVLSAIPNFWLKRQAEKEALLPVRAGLMLMTLIGAVLLVIRWWEFPALNVSWSDSAYGSIAVVLLGLHTVHLATDWVDSAVLTALMFTRHAKARRFVDVTENSLYWNFVVVAWIPIYVLLYFFPRWL